MSMLAAVDESDFRCTPTEWLTLEVLAARFRLGEVCWTFPSELAPALRRLKARDLVWFKSGVIAHTIIAGLTDAGQERWLRQPAAAAGGD